MHKPLSGQKIAYLVANGFYEEDMTKSQRALQELGAGIRIVSMDHGLANSWNGEGWGLNFAADNVLNEALAADFSMLVIPGGRRSVEKLKLTAHTGRFIGGFLTAGKPVAVFGSALELLAFFDKVTGYEVSGPARLRTEAEKAGAVWIEEGPVVDGNLLTSEVTDENRADFVEALCRHFSGDAVETAQAA